MTLIEKTKVRAVREAKSLLQIFGYNGFSFQKLADRLGIKQPSLYGHFQSKEYLGQVLIDDYMSRFQDWTETISVFGPQEKLGALFELFVKFSSDDRKVCPLSGILADFNSLPKKLHKPALKATQLHINWIQDVITEGQSKNIFRKDLSAEDLANFVVSAGFGAQLISKAFGDPEKIRGVKLSVMKFLETSATH